jgi:hypothetical protein
MTQCYHDCNGQTCGLKFGHVFQKGFDTTNNHQLQVDTKLNFDTEGNQYGLYLFFIIRANTKHFEPYVFIYLPQHVSAVYLAHHEVELQKY